jgi:polysaccharide biosynthesis protein PslJ
VLFLGFPVWWVLGLGAFILPIMAIPMAAWLFQQRTVLAPRGFGIWIAFLLWMFGSATQLDDPGKYIAFGYTASLYVAATILLLYIFNISREALPTSRVITIMVIFWIFVVIWGVLGVLLPTVSFTSPIEKLMPQWLVSNEFVYRLVHPALAQIQDILGYEQPRPSAPFIYATNWAAAFGLLTPFVILGWRHARTRAWKLLIAATFAVGVVPVVSSLGRGLWLSLSAGLTYAAIRSAIAGKSRTLRTILVLIATVLVVVYLTPLKTLVSDRFANPHSNQVRLSLYEEATERVMESPLIGFGTPQPARFNPNAPPVGTQGQLWQVLVSHGIVGALFFLGWFLYQFWRLRAASTDVGFWCHTLILIALIQTPFYDSLGIPLAVIMIAIAVAGRAARARSLFLGDV